MILGVTGGIACGKSVVAEVLQSLGAEVIDSDDVARKVVEKNSLALKVIAEVFGKEILKQDGTLNRPKLASIIFKDQVQREKLNKILHPIILSELKKAGSRAKSQGKDLVMIIPLLYETKAEELVECTWCVYADEKTQLARLVARDNLPEIEAYRRINAQLPIDEKAKRADYILDSRTSLNQFRANVVRLWEETKRRREEER